MSLVQPDPGVLRKAQRGDERAFSLIVRAYQAPVFNYVLRLVGDRSLALVPAALVGAAIVVFADLAARRLFAPTELPVGVATAVVGAPYLLWLLARANRIGAGG